MSWGCITQKAFAKPIATCLQGIQIVLANTTVFCHLHIMLPNVIQIVAILHKHLCNLAMFCYIIETSLLTWWQIFWHLPRNFSPSSAHFFLPTQKKFKDTTTLLPFNMVLKNNQQPSSVAKKPRIARTFYCPNPNCQKGFDTPKQFKLHIGLSKECHEAVSLIIHSKQVCLWLNQRQFVVGTIRYACDVSCLF